MSSKQVILFSGSTCVPCKSFKPIFTQVLEKHNLPFTIKEDDVDTMAKYGIRAVPTVIFLEEDGEVNHILSGKGLRSEVLDNAVTEFEQYTDEIYFG